jgi:hypothetical protein
MELYVQFVCQLGKMELDNISFDKFEFDPLELDGDALRHNFQGST